MKELGWNDYVCAGIVGNLMAEVGGQTLNIDPQLGNSYYGICHIFISFVYRVEE